MCYRGFFGGEPMFQNLIRKYLVVMLVCIVIGLFVYYASSVIVEGIISNSLTEIAQQGTDIVEKDIEAHMNILTTISQTEGIKREDLDISERVSILENYSEIDKFLRLTISDSEGNAVATGGERLFVRDRDYFKEAMAGNPFVSEPIESRIDGSMVIVLAVPIINEGKAVGIISATYPVEELSDIIGSIKYGGKGYAFILDQNAYIIAHGQKGYDPDYFYNTKMSLSSQNLTRLQEIEKRMTRGDTGAGSYWFEQQEKYLGFAPISGTKWSLAIAATKDEVFSDLNRLLTFLILLIISFSLSIFVVNAYLIYLKKRVKQHEKTSRNAMDIAKMVMITFNESGLITGFNRYAEEKTGYAREDVVGKKSIYEITDEKSAGNLVKACMAEETGAADKGFELSLVNAAGEQSHFLFNVNHSENFNKKYPPSGEIEIIGIDLTERVKVEKALSEKHEELTQVYEELSASQDELHSQFERIYQLAFYDTLTSLPNRAQFLQHLSDHLRDNRDRSIAIFIIDIDNFKYINDTFGYHYGNITLKEVADRLISISTDRFFVARLNGDEFSAIVEQPDYDESELVHIVEDIYEAFRNPFMMGSIKLNLSSSIGIAVNHDRAIEADTLLSYADAAMNKAKERGKNGYAFFDKSMTMEISNKLIMTNYLRDAISNNDCRLFYQPIYHASTKEICSFEGLLRWSNPHLGNVPPSDFIKLAEESGLIHSIGLWVFKEGCTFAKRINEGREKKILVSINVSPLQMLQVSFMDHVEKILEETGVDPHLLAIEITETAMIEVFESCLVKLEALKNIGITIYLDDFGTGYSSLNYLSKLPTSVIKLDRSFVWEVPSDDKVKQLTQTIISLSHKLGMDTVAEGVETEEQLTILRDYGCDLVQGYLFSKPVPEESAMMLLGLRR